MYFEEEWECPNDSVRYKKKLENERVFEFLGGLDNGLDDVRSRILSWRPLPSTRKVFAEVRKEENRWKVMLKETSTASTEVSALVTYRPSIGSGPKKKKGMTLVWALSQTWPYKRNVLGYTREANWLEAPTKQWKLRFSSHGLRKNSGERKLWGHNKYWL